MLPEINLHIAAALVLLIFAATTSYASENFVTAHVEKAQPEGSGAPRVIATRQGNLGGDIETLVVLYAYQIGEQRDRNHWQYLVAFQDGRPVTPDVLVGGGPQHFNSLEISDRTVILSGMSYARGDPMCCPSVSVEARYIYLNGYLVAKAAPAASP